MESCPKLFLLLCSFRTPAFSICTDLQRLSTISSSCDCHGYLGTTHGSSRQVNFVFHLFWILGSSTKSCTWKDMGIPKWYMGNKIHCLWRYIGHTSRGESLPPEREYLPPEGMFTTRKNVYHQRKCSKCSESMFTSREEMIQYVCICTMQAVTTETRAERISLYFKSGSGK